MKNNITFEFKKNRFLLFDNYNLIGYIKYHILKASKVIYIDLLWIDKDYRGNGYANILLSEFISKIKQESIKAIKLNVTPMDPSYNSKFLEFNYNSYIELYNAKLIQLIAFYEKYGFKLNDENLKTNFDDSEISDLMILKLKK
jgi:ribosomal protein S18 acetylase RimI-like enzyme